MKKEQKGLIIDQLTKKISDSPYFYITDASDLNVTTISKFRRVCFEKGVEFLTVKNTFLKKAMENTGNLSQYEPLFSVLKGGTSILFADDAKTPAKLLKEYRKKEAGNKKPLLKAAYIDSAIFIGDNQLDMLVAIKNKQEMIGEIVGLLQSPAKNVLGALQSGGNKLAGIVKALEERG